MNVSPNQTLRQFARAYRDAYLAENPGGMITKSEYARIYPTESRCDLWLGQLWHFIRYGGVLRRETCDSICREVGELMLDSMRHDYEACIPAGYLKPSTRKRNQEHEREMIEARKRGRQRAMGHGA